jgi:hypothetical protein
MSIIGSELLLGAAGAGGYEIERSLRFNSSDSAYCGRVPASAGNRTTWTFSAWIKRSKLGVLQRFFTGTTATNDNDWTAILFNASDQLVIGGYTTFFRTSNSVYRDCSAWYHLVVLADLGNGTNSLKLRAWINNEEVAWSSTSSNPTTTGINAANNHAIGAEQSPNNGGVGGYFDGYLADIHFIDGQALDPTSFGEFDDNGVWQPIAYAGSYGTNGFHLPFSDNSTAAALGTDTSGNSNNWTPNNLSVSTGSVASPVRFTWNTAGSGWTLSNSNYTATSNLVANYSRATTAALDGGTTYHYVLQQTPRDGDGGWFFADTTSVSNTHPDELGGNSLGMRVAESTIGTYGTFATANGTSDGQGQITGLSSLTSSSGNTTNSEWVVNMTARKVWVRNFGDSTWIKGGDPSNTSSTPTFSLPSGTIYFGYVGYNDVNKISLVTFVASVAANNDSLVDSPTNYGTGTGVGGEVRGNYATLNPLDKRSNAVLSNGNLETTNTARATIAIPSSGKWYCEVSATGDFTAGISRINTSQETYVGGAGGNSYGYSSANGYVYNNSSSITAQKAELIPGDIMGVAFDSDAATLYFYKNGVLQHTLTSLTGQWAFAVGIFISASNITANFGQRTFAYPLSGFKALCTTNLAEPTIADGSTAMDVALYTGNGSTQTISGLNFSPDFVWVKARNVGYSHRLWDVVRGATKGLLSDGTSAEFTEVNGLTSFNSDGFSVGTSLSESAKTYVAWTWDAGTSTVTNTDGSISSQVRANASAGFAVITGSTPSTNINFTFGHGLGVAPSLVIYKHTAVSGNWQTYHRSGGGNNYNLNSTAGPANSGTWSGLDPTSTLITIPSVIVSANSSAFVCYAFSPVAGYSSFGSYVGNGAQPEGPFIYTGFKPAFLMIKSSSAGLDGWFIMDNKRPSNNLVNKYLYANTSDSEADANICDFCANGFKIRYNYAGINQNAATYIYAAFAEHPFQSSRAR